MNPRFLLKRTDKRQERIIAAGLNMQESVLPREEAAVTAELVVGRLMVTNSSGGVTPSTVFGEERAGESR